MVMDLGKERRRGLGFYGWTGDTRTFSYDVVLERSLEFASAPRGLGLVAGERVAIIGSTTPHTVFSLLGVWLAGGIPSCLPPVALGRLADYCGATSRMLAALGPSVVLSDQRTAPVLDTVASAIHSRLGIHVTETLVGSNRFKEPVEAQPSDIALIQFSSGTTVDPKPIAIAHQSIIRNLAAMLSRYPQPHDQHSGVSWLPLYHDMGLTGGLLMALAS